MSVSANERIKLTATYLDTAAGGLFTTDVVAPLVAVVFGTAGPVSGPSALTLGSALRSSRMRAARFISPPARS